MKFSTQTVSMNPPILLRKLGGELFVPVTLASGAFTNGVCKAGTPINASGAKATTSNGSNDAVGILLNDVSDANPNGSLVKAFASINSAQAQAHSGVTYDNALKTALNLIVFE